MRARVNIKFTAREDVNNFIGGIKILSNLLNIIGDKFI